MVTFTVGEQGKRPGTGVPFGSDFEMLLVGKTPPTRGNAPVFIRTNGSHGRYSATTLLPPGGIGFIQIGGWGDFPTATPDSGAVDGEFWLPVNQFRPGE